MRKDHAFAPQAALVAPISGTVTAAPGRAGPVPPGRRDHRRSFPSAISTPLAGRQCARGRRAADAGGRAGRCHLAGDAGPVCFTPTDLGRARHRRHHPSPGGARPDRQSATAAQAGHVRQPAQCIPAATGFPPPCPKAPSSVKAMRRMSGCLQAGDAWRCAHISIGPAGRRLCRTSGGLKPGERFARSGGLFVDSAAQSQTDDGHELSFSPCAQRVLVVVLLAHFPGRGRGAVHQAQHRSLSRSGAAAGGDRHPEHAASRPRRSSAISPFPSKCRWRAFPMSPPSAPFRCSAFRM